MGKITAVYSQRERLAITLFYDPGRVSAAELAERARTGRLPDVNGRLLPAFACEVASVRTIASRARRSGVLHEHRGDVDLEASKALYRTLSVRARPWVESAESEAEIQRASRMLSELRDLEGALAKAPAPGQQGAVGRAMLSALRSNGGVYTEPEPVRAPEPKPAPEPAGPMPGEWMRLQVAALASRAAPVATGGRVNGCADATLQSANPADLRAYYGEPEDQPRRHRPVPGAPSYAYPGG